MKVSYKRTIITTHLSPDLDAICSLLGMYSYQKLRFPKKKFEMIVTSKPCYQRLKLKNVAKIKFVEELADYVKEGDELICLDGPTFDRFTFNPKLLKEKVSCSTCIDHHPGRKDKFTSSVFDVNAGATCKLIADMWFKSGKKMNKSTAETLLLGIVADTGTFSFIDPSNLNVFATVEQLIETSGLGIRDIHLWHMKLTAEALEVFQEFAKNMVRKKLKKLPNVIYSYIERDFAKKYDYDAIAEGYKQFLLCFVRNVEGYPWGFVAFPNGNPEGVYKIQIRSHTKFINAGRIAEQHFTGGGHKYASGGQIVSGATAKKICELILRKVV